MLKKKVIVSYVVYFSFSLTFNSEIITVQFHQNSRKNFSIEITQLIFFPKDEFEEEKPEPGTRRKTLNEFNSQLFNPPPANPPPKKSLAQSSTTRTSDNISKTFNTMPSVLPSQKVNFCLH